MILNCVTVVILSCCLFVLNVHMYYVFVCTCVCVDFDTPCVGKAKDNLQESVISFYNVSEFSFSGLETSTFIP